jgi:signal transduction histidine kinase
MVPTNRLRSMLRFWQRDSRTRAMLMAVPDLMFLMTRDGVYIDYYARDPRTLYAAPEAFLGRNITDIMPADVAAQFQRAVQRVKGPSEPVEVVYALPLGGETRHFEARLVSVDDDQIMSIVRDVTDQVRAESALRHSENALRESHQRIRQLARRLIATQESERARVARELHDDLSQKLALLSIELNQLTVKNHLREDERRERLRAVTEQAADIAGDVHRISHALHPSMLSTLGVVKAVEKYCSEFSTAHDVTIDFTHTDRTLNPSPEVELCAFRIVQESLLNAAKHSGTTRVSVRVASENGSLLLQVADAGRGFEPGDAEGTGLGLVSMRERVDALGGQFSVQSAPGKGTRIGVRLPLAGHD